MSKRGGRESDMSCAMRLRTIVTLYFPTWSTAMSLDPALRNRIDSLLKAHPVVLFMKGTPDRPHCGFSAKAVGILQDLNVTFSSVNVLSDQDIREGIKHFSDWPTIPQLYVKEEFVGGSDIMMQLYDSGELSAILGVPMPDRSPPAIEISPAAAAVLKDTLAKAPQMALAITIDAQFQPDFRLVPYQEKAITSESSGIRVQFDLASARRANGIVIDWVDDIQGQGLIIQNPNQPQSVPEISAKDAATRINAGQLTLIDVRGANERQQAVVSVPFYTLDPPHAQTLATLPKDTPLAFLCHHGHRSQQAAHSFQQQGFQHVYSVSGGIHAWACEVDSRIPQYRKPEKG